METKQATYTPGPITEIGGAYYMVFDGWLFKSTDRINWYKVVLRVAARV